MSTIDLELHDHLESHHGYNSAKYIKNIIYGGIDGIITTFSIIAASYGAGFEIKYIITMGVANLMADGFSMGMGDYISSYFENLYILSEKKKEEEEYINNNLYEIGEMNELFVKEGYDQEDADSLVTMLISKEKYKPLFIKNMVLMELGLTIPEDNYKQIIKKEAFITFLSFVGFGFVPILFYIIFFYSEYDSYTNIFIINCVITFCTMFGLGVYQAKITKQNIYKGGIVLTINGVIAASLAFIIGYSINLIL